MAAKACKVTLHASIRELPAAEWDALSGENFYLSQAWLRVVEADSRPPPEYLAAWSGDGHLAGGLPVYPLTQPPGNRLADPAYAVSDRPAADGWYPALTGGARIGYANNIPVRAELAASDKDAVYQALLESLTSHAADSGFRSCALLYLSQSGKDQLARVPGWPLVFSSAEALLDVAWPSFEDYLASLSRHRRANVRADLRRFSQSGLEFRLTRLGEIAGEAAPLAVNVQYKYGHQSSVARQLRFFGDCASSLGDDALVFGCFDGHGLIGFALAFQWHDTLYIRSAGFDYDRLPRRGEHFTVMFYEPIRYAIEQGLARVHFGTESVAAKAQRGCQFRPLWSAAWLDRPFGDTDLQRFSEVSEARLRAWDEDFAVSLGYEPSRAWDHAGAAHKREHGGRGAALDAFPR